MIRNRLFLSSAIALALAALPGCPHAIAPAVDDDGPAQPRASHARERKSVGLTVYNDDTVLVRDVRTMALARGLVALEMKDVTARIEPETVHLRALDPAASVRVFEQNFRFDLLSPESLLARSVGERVSFHRWDSARGTEQVTEGMLVAFNAGTPVFSVGGEIVARPPGTLSFPKVPADLVAEPTLVMRLGSDREQADVEVSYLSGGMGWRADYTLKLDATHTRADLQGWVTMHNESGATFENAGLQLVAGDVHRAPREPEVSVLDDLEDKDAPRDERESTGKFTEETFFEYHLYSFNRRVTFLDRETKQLSLLAAHDVPVTEHLETVADAWMYRGQHRGALGAQVVVSLELLNAEASHLGMSLPKGTVRLFARDSSDSEQFVGSDALDHTPRDEKVRVKLGRAFDFSVARKQLDFKLLSSCDFVTKWEIRLHNATDRARDVDAVEPLGGEWELAEHSHPFVKRDAHTIVFTPSVPAHGEVVIVYEARVRGC